MKNNYTNTKSRFLLHFLLLVTTFLFYGNSWGQNVATYTTAGTYTWTCPPNVTSIQVEAWGGGGAGGGTGATFGSVRRGGGGGGGAYAKTTSVSVTPGTTYTIIVGSGGAGNSAAAGSTGGNSSFGGSIVVAVGGSGGGSTNSATGGVAGSGGLLGSSTGTTVYSGGNGFAGSGTISGGGGSSAGTGANGNNATASVGGTAPTGGAAGATGVSGNNTGVSGSNPGGGGSGSSANSINTSPRAGGAGGAGQVKLTWTGYCTPLATVYTSYITNFTTVGATSNINKTSTFTANGGGYSNNYATDAMSIVAGNAFTGTVSMVPTATGSNGVSVFIDYNNNGVFTDSGEQAYTSAAYQGSPWSTTSITIPSLTAAGDYVMRVVIDWNSTSPTSCSFASGARGEMEDYKLTVTAPVTPTITSFTPSSGCSSTASVVITGTNFTGATGVTIGGTAVASYTVNSATQITATVGTGTTGTIAVTTGGGTAASAGTFTVNPTPAAIAGGATTVCLGATTPAFTNATGGGTWSITPGTGTATIDSGGIVTGGTVGTVTVVYTVGSCSVTKALTIVNTLPTVSVAGTAGSITSSGAAVTGSTISVLGCGSITAYGIEYSTTSGFATGSGTQIAGTGFSGSAGGTFSTTLSGLAASTTYYYRAYATNSAGTNWSSQSSFTTLQTPASLPYSDDLSTNSLSFINGSQTNKWAYGGATGNTGNSIYISNDSGVTNAYSNGSASVVQAYRDISIPSGTTLATLSFDWKANGESTYDYLRVWLVPTSFIPTAGTQISTGSGRIQVGGNLNLQTTWQTYTNTTLNVSTFAGATMRLVFEWRNDGSGGTTPPGAIDNINMSIPSCQAPASITATTAITDATATLNWTASPSTPSSGYEWEVRTSGAGGSGSTGLITSGSVAAGVLTANATGLSAATSYTIYVRANCGGSDFSSWASGGAFVSACVVPNTPGAITITAPSATGFTLNYAAASPAPTSYILFYTNGNTLTTIPTLVNGTTYANNTGYTFGADIYTCITNTSVSPNTLSGGASNTQFNYFLFSKSTTNGCSGAPYYSSGVTVSAITCPAPPTLPVASSITTNSATLSWTASVVGGGAATINYTLEVFSDAGLTTHISGSPFTMGTAVSQGLTGLTAGTTYYYRIKANNGCDSSALTGSFVTVCNAISIFPSTEAYSTYLPNCWSEQTGALTASSTLTGASSSWYSYYYGNTGSDNAATFNLYDGASNNQWLISPTFDLGLTPSLHQIQYNTVITNYYSTTNPSTISNNKIKVVVSTDNGATWSNTNIIKTYTGAATYSSKLETIDLTGYSGQIKIGFLTERDAADAITDIDFFVDNFVVRLKPSPITITPASSTTLCSGESVGLTASSAASYTYTWSPSVGLNTTSGATVTANPTSTTTYTVTGTSGSISTTKQVTVTVNPAPSDVSLSASSATVCKNTVQTIIATGGNYAANITVLSENFDSGAFPSGWTAATNVGGFSTPARDFKTTTEVKSYGNTWLASPSADVGGYGGTGDCLYFHSYLISATGNSLLVLPTYDLSTYTTATLSFYVYNSDGTDVMIVQARQGTNAFAQVNATTYGVYSNWTLVTIDLSSYVGSGNNAVDIRFRCNSDYGNSNIALDNILLTATQNVQNITWSPTTDLYTNAACTTAYTSGHATTVYAKPTTTRTYTATSTLGSCSKTADVTFTSEAVSWSGTTPSWSGTPAANKSIVFDADYTSPGGGTVIEGCDCTVTSGNITIASEDVLVLQNDIAVNSGLITFENNASLIQVNDVSNSGNIVYNRTSPLTVGGSDYVYWSSPVAGQTVPSGQNYIWNNGAGTLGGWASAATSTMGEGQGVIMRGVGSKTFTGIPFNGDVSVDIHRRAVTGLDDNWNLVGNPYPSAINANKFIQDSDNGNIIGTIALWTHGNPMSAGNAQPYYANYTYSYNPADYIYYNTSGTQSGPTGFNGNIAAGQSFFVQMVDGATASSSSIKFKNSMRTDAGAAYDNSQFYRNASTTDEKHRIWLDIVNSSSLSDRIMVGYISNATNENDRLYDAARSTSTTGLRIYSLIGAEKMAIQGRALPFDTNDIVPLAYNAPTTGNYSIAIHAVDGLFETQDVYLEDTQLNIVHNLKQAPYSFTVATVGENNVRFKIRYTTSTLGDEDFDSTDNVFIATKNALKVFSTAEQIESISVFDLLGRTIYNKNKINANEFTIPVERVNAPLIVKVKLTNGVVVDRKVLF